MKTPYKYVVCSKTASSMNSERCWVNIRICKLGKAVKEGADYWFVFNIGRKNFVYSINACELKKKLENSDVPLLGKNENNERFSFYVEYAEGKLYATVSANDEDVLIKLAKQAEFNGSLRECEIAEGENIATSLGLEFIPYEDMSPKGQEIHNIQKLSSLLANYGIECLRITNDEDGADVMAYYNPASDKKKNGKPLTLMIQVKGRYSAAKKYTGKDLYIAFPCEEGWYLIPHDKILDEMFKKGTLDTTSWKEGSYSIKSLSKKDKVRFSPYLIKWPEGKRNQ